MGVAVRGQKRLKPATRARIAKAVARFLPVAELVLYDANGEWRYSLTVFDAKFRAITSEGCLGDRRELALRKARVIADRLGLSKVRRQAGYVHMWRKLVPEREF